MSCYLNMMQLTYTGNIWHSVSRRVSGSGGSGRGSGGNIVVVVVLVLVVL